MLRPHAKEEPIYESHPDMDDQNFSGRELRDWHSVRQFFGRSRRQVVELVFNQDLAGEEDQSSGFDEPA